MAHFYGSCEGNRKVTTRCGTKNSGYTTRAASWEGAVVVNLFFNEDKKEDWAEVCLTTHEGQGKNITLYWGPVSGRNFKKYKK